MEPRSQDEVRAGEKDVEVIDIAVAGQYTRTVSLSGESILGNVNIRGAGGGNGAGKDREKIPGVLRVEERELERIGGARRGENSGKSH